MRVKWGIVSTAHINRLFLAGARESPDVEILAIASRDQAKAEQYARDNGIQRAYGSYEQLLADPDIDAVYISLPNSLHIDWTISALEAGKHVLCEKPLSRHTTEVERAFDTAKSNDRLLMEAFMWRHNPQTRRLSELVAQQAVGRIRIIRAAFGFVASDPQIVRLDPNARRRGADGRRVLLRERRAADRGRARARRGRAGPRRPGRRSRRRVRGHHAIRRRRHRALRRRPRVRQPGSTRDRRRPGHAPPDRPMALPHSRGST